MTTAQIPEICFDRLDAWEAIVADACVPLHITVPGFRFKASIATQVVENLTLSQIRSVGCECDHTLRHVSRTNDDCFLISLQRYGSGALVQDGKNARLAEGDLVLYDSTRPFEWHFPNDLTQLVIRIPREALRYRIQAPNSYAGLRIPCNKGINKLAWQHFLNLFEELGEISPASASCLATGAVDLLTGVLCELSRNEPGPQTNIQALHLNKAYAFIADNIRKPDLCPDDIASALGISVRYLHKLFLATETSVSRHILELRLDGCAKTLIDTSQKGLAISAVAYAWGFEDPTHFSRVFKERFGVSAREYRALYAK